MLDQGREIMSKLPKTEDFAADAKVVSRTYRGPDRRDPDQVENSRVERTVKFDAKGNPVLEVRTDVPRRREDDNTIDLLKCLDADALKLQLEDEPKTPSRKRR
jgi:hypothetical protein